MRLSFSAFAAISALVLASFVSATTYNSTYLIKAQLAASVNATIEALQDALAVNNSTKSGTSTIALLEAVVEQINNYDLSPSLNTTSDLASMASAINDTLNSLESAAITVLSDATSGAVEWADIEACLIAMVTKGGFSDGESCFTNAGVTVSGLAEIMASVLDSYSTLLNTDVLELAAEALDPSFVALLPGEKWLLGNISAAFTSVEASIAGDLTTAMALIKECFEKSINQTTFATELEYIDSCSRNTSSDSTYTELKTLYISVINQFVGYLTPNIIESVQAITEEYLASKNITSTATQRYFISAIYNSTISIIASNAGNEATYAYALADCLKTLVGTTDSTSAANLASTAGCLSSPTGAALSIKEIVFGYIQQVWGVLPPELAAFVEKEAVAALNATAAGYAGEVEKLHEIFEETDVGPKYVTCYEAFVDCLFSNATGILTVGNTNVTCLLGSACQTQPDGTANPYAGISPRPSSLTVSIKHSASKSRPSQALKVRVSDALAAHKHRSLAKKHFIAVSNEIRTEKRAGILLSALERLRVKSKVAPRMSRPDPTMQT